MCPKLIWLPTTEGEVLELTDGYLEAHGFPQGIGAIDWIHIETAEPSEHYSDINGMLRKRIIPSCEKILLEGRDPVPVFLLGDPAYPLLPFLMKEFSGGGRNERENFFVTNCQVLVFQ